MSLSPLALRAEIAALLPRLRRFARGVTRNPPRNIPPVLESLGPMPIGSINGSL